MHLMVMKGEVESRDLIGPQISWRCADFVKGV